MFTRDISTKFWLLKCPPLSNFLLGHTVLCNYMLFHAIAPGFALYIYSATPSCNYTQITLTIIITYIARKIISGFSNTAPSIHIHIEITLAEISTPESTIVPILIYRSATSHDKLYRSSVVPISLLCQADSTSYKVFHTSF